MQVVVVHSSSSVSSVSSGSSSDKHCVMPCSCPLSVSSSLPFEKDVDLSYDQEVSRERNNTSTNGEDRKDGGDNITMMLPFHYIPTGQELPTPTSPSSYLPSPSPPSMNCPLSPPLSPWALLSEPISDSLPSCTMSISSNIITFSTLPSVSGMVSPFPSFPFLSSRATSSTTPLNKHTSFSSPSFSARLQPFRKSGSFAKSCTTTTTTTKSLFDGGEKQQGGILSSKKKKKSSTPHHPFSYYYSQSCRRFFNSLGLSRLSSFSCSAPSIGECFSSLLLINISTLWKLLLFILLLVLCSEWYLLGTFFSMSSSLLVHSSYLPIGAPPSIPAPPRKPFPLQQYFFTHSTKTRDMDTSHLTNQIIQSDGFLHRKIHSSDKNEAFDQEQKPPDQTRQNEIQPVRKVRDEFATQDEQDSASINHVERELKNDTIQDKLPLSSATHHIRKDDYSPNPEIVGSTSMQDNEVLVEGEGGPADPHRPLKTITPGTGLSKEKADIADLPVFGKKVIFQPPSESLKVLIYDQDREEFEDIRTELSAMVPFDEPIEVTEESSGKRLMFTFEDVLGGGGQGKVVYASQAGIPDVHFAIKIFSRVSKNEEKDKAAFLRNQQSELAILSIVPSNMTPKEFSESHQIVMPIGVYTPTETFTPPPKSKMTYHNKWIMYPVFAGDLRRLELPWTGNKQVKVEICIQMILAVLNVHDQDIVHADIKMQNFFVHPDGRIFLGDFSLSKKLGTTVGPNAGTLRFLPPEHMKSKQEKQDIVLSAKKDVWSLGVVLYLMWCKKRYPFGITSDDDKRTVMNKLVEAEDENLNMAYCMGAPRGIKDLIRLMLRVRASERPTLRQLYEHHSIFNTRSRISYSFTDDWEVERN